MNRQAFRTTQSRWLKGLLVLAVVAASFLAPSRSFAVTSGSGVWDFMIFGNYNMVSPDTGEAYKNTPAPTWNNLLNNGYGGGVGVAYWFNDMIAFRIEAQTDLYTIPTAQGGGSLQSTPLTGGLEIKLWGNPDYYLYFVIDAGAGYEANMSGQSFFGKSTANSWTAYGDAGLGFNIDWVFVEAKIAYMPQAIAHGVSGGNGQNALWYVPLTAGFNF
ncbi:MAG: hypothetical protein M0T83_09455 [Nitrospiraceae bacterium]|nr:hypothetical protein [Nitrospiraceae bacterium]